MTGRLSSGDAFVHTLRYRQSSLRGSIGVKNNCVKIEFPPSGSGCAHMAPNLSATSVPLHGVAGCGARHRKSPTGGLANGMPL
jgi:hypothetical protein